ncbi:MAG: hypothetical protein ACOC26_04145 [Halochromatium sp.]
MPEIIQLAVAVAKVGVHAVERSHDILKAFPAVTNGGASFVLARRIMGIQHQSSRSLETTALLRV